VNKSQDAAGTLKMHGICFAFESIHYVSENSERVFGVSQFKLQPFFQSI